MNILITGGTGSFGKQYITRLLKENPTKIIVLSRDELKQYEMAQQFKDDRLRFFIGDVRDRERLNRAFTDVDIVVHAAAMKQIPIAEYNPFECVKTNILGAQNVIEAAIDAGVKKVVALSTDKAVNPINLYGSTKLCAEKLFIQGNAYSKSTRFACVRYGNVIGSRGSVIPLFKRQAKEGIITVTDERMTRFWITLDGAVDLVQLALREMAGGEIFIPKIPSMRMVDLAEAIGPNCDIKYIGIRPGEKLHEAMITADDARRTVERDDYFIIQPDIADDARQDWGVKVEASNVPDGFEYASNKNDWWLSAEELGGMIDDNT